MRLFDWGIVVLMIAIVFHVFLILRMLTDAIDRLDYIDEIFKESDKLIKKLEEDIAKDEI